MRPTQWSEDEDSKRMPFESVTQIEGRVETFLWARDCTYEISASQAGQATIFAFSENASEIRHVFTDLAELAISFGYACAHEEREHRNRVARKMSYGVHEAWVGRDFSRYLPGLYWLTAIPVGLQQSLGVSVDLLRDAALEMNLLGNRNWLVSLYAEPEDWGPAAARIDAWCSVTPGVFSKAAAEEVLSNARNFLEASTLIKEWR